MGCCNSNIRKQNHSDILIEERLIQGAERQLFFSSRQFTDILKLIETMHQISENDISSICDTFGVSLSSPSGSFLQSLSSKGHLSLGMLRSLAILLCPNDSKNKTNQVMSYSKNNLIDSIKDLITISIDIIPSNLENLEKFALIYTKNLKLISHEYVKELDSLTLEQIQELLKDFVISSNDIRIKMFSQIKNSNLIDGFADKLDNFRLDTERKEGNNQEQDLNPKSLNESRDVSHAKEKEKGSHDWINTEKVLQSEGIEEFGKTEKRKAEGSELIEEDDNAVDKAQEREGFIKGEKVEKKNEEEFYDKNGENQEVIVEIEVKLETNAGNGENSDGGKIEELMTNEIKINFNSALGKLDIGSPSDSTPATNLNDDFDSIKSPRDLNDDTFKDDAKSETSKPDDFQSNPFALSIDCQTKSEPVSDLSSPKLVPRKSSGLAAKLKATQAFIRTGNKAETFSEVRSSLTGDGQAFTRRRVKQEPFVMDRKSLTSPKSAVDPSRLSYLEESKD